MENIASSIPYEILSTIDVLSAVTIHTTPIRTHLEKIIGMAVWRIVGAQKIRIPAVGGAFIRTGRYIISLCIICSSQAVILRQWDSMTVVGQYDRETARA